MSFFFKCEVVAFGCERNLCIIGDTKDIKTLRDTERKEGGKKERVNECERR